MDDASVPTQSCTTCEKPQNILPQPLKRCAKCRTSLYCSRECQQVDWRIHKRICAVPGSTPQNSTPSPSTSLNNPGFNAINQIFSLDSDDYLHKFTEEQAFEQLIDCFRMRMEDEYKFGGNGLGIYDGQDPRPEFKKFLNLAEKRAKLLPPWWNAEKRRKCVSISTQHNGWSNINHAVEKSDIQEHYADGNTPMMLRILGEKIYGKGFM